MKYKNGREIQSGDIFLAAINSKPVRVKITHLKGGAHQGICTLPPIDPIVLAGLIPLSLHIADVPPPAATAV